MAEIPLPVTSQAIDAEHRLVDRNSAYHDNLSPPLTWGRVGGVQSWVLMVEDPDAPTPRPFLHWLMWNIPAKADSLPEALPPTAAPQGLVQGANGTGARGWSGPLPPAGTGPHHYHIELFALDVLLSLDPAASREDVIAAMKGHVLASGEAVATYAAPDSPPS
jgi:Raf kinase inhibitor-like YbhB/YbcL family protein